jgi:hypothetical protein
MNRSAAVLCATLLSSFASAQSLPQVIKEDKGHCRMAVPAEWKQQDIMGKKLSMAAAPDKSSDAVVSLMDGTDWNTFRSVIWSVYTQEKSRPKLQDDGKRLWFEIAATAPGMTSWYVAVPGRAGTCNAQVNFRKGDKKAEELARKIVECIAAG